MAIRNWRRLRDEAAKHREDAPEDRLNPWGEGPSRLGDLGTPASTGADSGGDGSERVQQYADWADRMKAKRERNRELTGQGGPCEPSAGLHWSTDALYAESRLVEEQETLTRPNPWRTRELLAQLDLTEGASIDDIGFAYRRLAKEHHPDRFVGADDQTKTFHADRFRSINAAYKSLKALHTV